MGGEERHLGAFTVDLVLHLVNKRVELVHKEFTGLLQQRVEIVLELDCLSQLCYGLVEIEIGLRIAAGR